MNEFATPAPFAPKTFGQILDHTYRLTRTHFKLLVGIAAYPSCLFLLVIGLLEAVVWVPMIRQWPKPPSLETLLRYLTPSVIIPVIAVLTLFCLAIFSIYLAAASYASTQADSGVKVTIRESHAVAWRHGGRYLWLLVLCYLYAFLPLLLTEGSALIGASVFAHRATTANPALFLLIPLAVLVYIAARVYGIIMGLRLSLSFPACVEENLTARAAIRRSFQLVRGAKGRIFLVVLVIYAVLYAAMMVIELVAMLLGAIGFFLAMALHAHFTPPWSYVGLSLLGICVFAALILFISLTYAALVTALAVLYHDQRLRNDGPLPAPAQAKELP
jgi:hypothetical protein